LAKFGATLYNEGDLNQLSKQLIAVVQETMRPAHDWLWWRQPERAEKQMEGCNHGPDHSTSPPQKPARNLGCWHHG
ncbi:MAG TPA: hypothetical protein VF844_12445, partial [Ktedonobacteraceae bacterium]